MKEFKGRIVASGTVTAKALVSHGGLNTLASFQKALQFGDKKATCGDQNNPDLYGKQMAGKALCLPTTIGSTTGGLVLYCACSMNRQPACMLFSEPIDSLAAAGAILADVWLDNVQMPVIDSLGEEFLEYVKDDMDITVKEDGTVVVEVGIDYEKMNEKSTEEVQQPEKIDHTHTGFENTICLSNVCEHKIPCKASGRMKNGRNHGETGEKSEKRRRGSLHRSDGTEQAEHDTDRVRLSGERRGCCRCHAGDNSFSF